LASLPMPVVTEQHVAMLLSSVRRGESA